MGKLNGIRVVEARLQIGAKNQAKCAHLAPIILGSIPTVRVLLEFGNNRIFI